jgi:DME family drug/metabolite transporter
MGIKATTAAAGTFLFAINPVLFAAAERFLYRRALPRATLPCLAAIVAGGVWLFVAGRAAGTATAGGVGNLLCFLSTLFFVAYLVASERVSRGIPHGLYLCLIYLWGGLLTLPIAALAGAFVTGAWSDPWAYLWLGAVVLLPTAVGHGSLAYAVRFTSPLVVSFFTLFEPILATLFALLFLAETPRAAELPSYALFLLATTVFLGLRLRAARRASSSPA